MPDPNDILNSLGVSKEGQSAFRNSQVGQVFGTQTDAQKSITDQYNQLYSELNNFFQEMSKPFDPNDPSYRAILNQASGEATMQANESGVQGPANASQGVAARTLAASGIQNQRYGMALQGLGIASGVTQGAGQFLLGQQAQANAGWNALGQGIGTITGGLISSKLFKGA